MKLSIVRTVAKLYPDILPHLSPRVRFLAAEPAEYKTIDYFVHQVELMVRHVYDGYMQSEFIDLMASLIQGQILQAVASCWNDEGTGGEMPDYLSEVAENMILQQYDFVDGYYADIVSAREMEQGLDALLARAALWGNRWNDAYNEAMRLIMAQLGGKLRWVFGDTEHCGTCQGLNGIVAYASEWDELGVHPQGAPNDALECGGWRCQCSLEPTEQRRSPKAFDTIMNVVNK